jgi:hypothetical protein
MKLESSRAMYINSEMSIYEDEELRFSLSFESLTAGLLCRRGWAQAPLASLPSFLLWLPSIATNLTICGVQSGYEAVDFVGQTVWNNEEQGRSLYINPGEPTAELISELRHNYRVISPFIDGLVEIGRAIERAFDAGDEQSSTRNTAYLHGMAKFVGDSIEYLPIGLAFRGFDDDSS